MFVRDRMSSPAVTITSDTPFQDALKLIQDRGFRRLPVVDDKGRLVGIVTERDLLDASPSRRAGLAIWELNYLLAKLQVKSIMTKDVITTMSDTFLEDAARLMAENKIGALPVVDEDNRVVGVITETDLFKALVEMFAGGRFGLRVTLSVPHERGVVAELCKAVFDLGGSIVSVGSFNGDVFSERGFVIKVQDVRKDQLVDTLEALGDHVIDAHEVEPQYNRKEDVMAPRILVPLDGSALAERALPCATMLARGLSAELVLLRAVCIPADFNGTPDDVDLKKHSLLEQLEAQACDYLDHIVSRLQGTGLSVQTVVQSEPAAEAIVDCAEQMDIQQIVMGTHGYSGFSRLRHGSVAERVLQSASVPVLMVCARIGGKSTVPTSLRSAGASWCRWTARLS